MKTGPAIRDIFAPAEGAWRWISSVSAPSWAGLFFFKASSSKNAVLASSPWDYRLIPITRN